MISHIYCVGIFVLDRDRARDFYRNALDFEVTADVTDPINSDNRWLTMSSKSSNTNLMLLKRPQAKEPADASRSAQVILATDDIVADCERIKSHGGTVVGPPRRAGWGDALETHFADPEGNVFMLVQQISPR